MKGLLCPRNSLSGSPVFVGLASLCDFYYGPCSRSSYIPWRGGKTFVLLKFDDFGQTFGQSYVGYRQI